MEPLRSALRRDTDIASLAAFRVLFGAVLAYASLRYVAKGYLYAQLIAPRHHFAYGDLTFVSPLGGPWMYGAFALLTLSACAITLGIAYRPACITFLALFTYTELIDRATYLNHYYLVTLLCVLLTLLPLDRAFSWRTRLRPGDALGTLPAHALWTLRTQVAVVYVFAGIAKLNADWLVHAQPLRIWLAAHADVPVLGPWLASTYAAHVASIAGAAFDLCIVPCLLCARTRCYALASALVFHALTALLFPIGVFPWVMSACVTLFCAPDWPRRWLVGARPPACGRPLGFPLGVHTALQIVLPLHAHLAHPDAAWTARGFDFAWRLMAAEKHGSVVYTLHDTQGHAEPVPLARLLTPLQQRALAADPALICAFARELARREATRGRAVRVQAQAHVSLNGRPARLLVDPTADLARADPQAVTLALGD